MNKTGYTPPSLMNGVKTQKTPNKAEQALINNRETMDAMHNLANNIGKALQKHDKIFAALLSQAAEGCEILRERTVAEAGGAEYDHIMGDIWFEIESQSFIRVQPFMSEFEIIDLDPEYDEKTATMPHKWKGVNEVEDITYEIEGANKQEAASQMYVQAAKQMQSWAKDSRADETPSEETEK